MGHLRKFDVSDLTIKQANTSRRKQNPPTPETMVPHLVTPPTPYQRTCAERVHALTSFCYEEYNVDPMHVRLIVSALLPSAYLPLWMIYETTRTPFWNHLNHSIKLLGIPPVFNIAGMRMLRDRMSNEWYKEAYMTRHEQPRVMIDTQRIHTMEWKKRMVSTSGYWAMTGECAKAGIPVLMMKVPRAGSEEEFARLLRMVIDPHERKLLPEPVVPSTPLVEIIHALPRLNEELVDGEALFNTITMLPTSHAALYGRTTSELVDADWYSMMQVVRGSIREYLRSILYWFYMADAKFKVWVRASDMGEKLGRDRNVMRRQLDKLVATGVMDQRMHKARWLYALTDLGMLGACIVGAGPGARWW